MEEEFFCAPLREDIKNPCEKKHRKREGDNIGEHVFCDSFFHRILVEKVEKYHPTCREEYPENIYRNGADVYSGVHNFWTRGLFCIFDNALFSDEIDLDLSWIATIRFNLCGNLLCLAFGIEIGDRIRIDEHTDFSSCGECVRLVHARKAHRHIFHLLDTLDVILNIHTSSSRTHGRYGIRDLYDFCLDTYLRDIVVVSLDDIDDFFIQTVFACDTSANLRMRSLDIVVHGFADIMEETSLKCERRICTEESRNRLCDIGNFLGMHEEILSVARAESELPDEGQYLIRDTDDAHLVDGFSS